MIEPHPSSHPFIEFQHRGIRVADAEVVHPPEDVAPQFVDDARKLPGKLLFHGSSVKGLLQAHNFAGLLNQDA